MEVTQETLENSELINWTIFQELLMMDEDEEGFALSLVQTFADQAKRIFSEMEELLKDSNRSTENLQKLSSLGHYLKGSAAALGLQRIQYECERIQNYGKQNNFDNYSKAAEAKNLEDWQACCNDAYQCALDYYKQSKDLLTEYFEEPL
ncbi:DEKNAAC101787 [Brettanomyces naardenensis]|uniref:DEKNAAC101787 n=1 Tax=Brettanomyces naardenensis TaxID=13370 RepID=A0A448YJ75_BRENA|nr:DEKNAAC101787 [Brettanomyces naardenensis]